MVEAATRPSLPKSSSRASVAGTLGRSGGPIFCGACPRFSSTASAPRSSSARSPFRRDPRPSGWRVRGRAPANWSLRPGTPPSGSWRVRPLFHPKLPLSGAPGDCPERPPCPAGFGRAGRDERGDADRRSCLGGLDPEPLSTLKTGELQLEGCNRGGDEHHHHAHQRKRHRAELGAKLIQPTVQAIQPAVQAIHPAVQAIHPVVEAVDPRG
jgi:hypothetical protein